MLSGPIIYPITEGLADASNFVEHQARIRANAVAAAESGVGLFQIREKRLSARSLFELTCSVVSATKGSGLRILVNGRPDIAISAGAAGVHLPANGLPADAVRTAFGSEFLIGVSCHDEDELLAAQNGGADFATFSPVFASPGKGEPAGIEKLRAVVEKFEGFPVIALGGVSVNALEQVLATGAAGVAAIRALNTSERIREFAARAK